MADQLEVYQEIAQVETTETPALQVYQTLAQVEIVTPISKLIAYQVIAQVEYVPMDELSCTSLPPDDAYGQARIIDVDAGLVLRINGVDMDVVVESVKIEDELSTRSTCSFRLVDKTHSLSYTCGELVEIYYDRILRFAGTIDHLKEIYEWECPYKFIEIEGVGWEQLCDRAVVTNSYADMTLRALVTKIIYDDTWLNEEGIVLGTADDSTVLEIVNFNYETASSAFKKLADATGYAWKITPEKVLNFYDRATNFAPFTIGDGAGASIEYRGLTFDRDRSQYRNRQWMIGGHDFIDPEPEYLAGENAASSIEAENRKRTFQLKWPVGTIEGYAGDGTTELGIWKVFADNSMDKQRVGQRNENEDGDLTIVDEHGDDWRQWFWEYGEKEISQNSARDQEKNPTIAPNEKLFVRYRGLVPLIQSAENETGIAERKSVEGGTGLYEAVDNDDTIEGRDAAEERVLRLLSQFGRIPRIVPFQVDLIGLQPGQLMEITLAGHGLAAVQFLVNSVTTIFLTRGTAQMARCDVEVLDGERQGGWSDYWAKLSKRGRLLRINASTVVELVKNFDEVVGVSDTIDTYTAGATLHDWDEDPFTVAWLGIIQSNSGRAVCAFTWGRSRWGEPDVTP